MKLTDLDPAFVKTLGNRIFRHAGVTFAEADGILFLCPKCFVANKGHMGTHSVLCWKPGVSHDYDPDSKNHPRWPITGTGFHDLTLTPSILLLSGCKWHGFVTNGEVT